MTPARILIILQITGVLTSWLTRALADKRITADEVLGLLSDIAAQFGVVIPRDEPTAEPTADRPRDALGSTK